ncbi:MAG: DUF4402 domain-containing protein [Candidatus Wallbacteria bacterium]|nr:DUF4402 domain-containing protein [Candidatus Wallbacteria bacterium]
MNSAHKIPDLMFVLLCLILLITDPGWAKPIAAIKISREKTLDLGVHDIADTPVTVAPVPAPPFGKTPVYDVRGEPGYEFEITVLTATLDLDPGAGVLNCYDYRVGDGTDAGFTVFTGIFPASGQMTVYIGASLTIDPSQNAGTFTASNTCRARYTTVAGTSSDIFSTRVEIVIPPVTIVKVRDLSFGSIMSPLVATPYTVPPDGTITAQFGQAAQFTCDGQDGHSYLASVLPNITLTSGVNTIPVTNFQISRRTPNPVRTGNPLTLNFQAGSTDTLYVGATATLSAGQPGGTYTGTNTITLIYN